MAIGRRRARQLTLGAVLAGMLLAVSPCTFALDPSLDISQYAHTAWKVREGFAKGTIVSVAQTPDGYLWLGTEFGLLRFDGVRSFPWQPPPGQHLPSTYIRRLLVAHDGTLWIGTWKGLASWQDGKLTQYPELAGQIISALLEDREGTVWAGGLAFPPPGKLCAIHSATAHCFGENGALGYGAVSLFEDGKGNLWVGALDGLWRWKPGPPKFYSLPGEPDGIRGLAEDDDGTLLIGMRGGMRRLVGGKPEPYPLPGNVPHFVTRRLLRDRDGSLWVGTSDRGLVHVHQRQTDVFSLPDGLTGDDVLALFQDREGSVWAATLNGLDRFRDFAVTTISAKQGLSSAAVGSVLADRNGSVWLGTYGGLNRWNNGKITIASTGSVKRDGKLNGLSPNSLFQDDRGQIWISTDAGVGYLENDRFVPISGVPGGPVHGIAQDKAGNLWIANESGLFRLSARSEVQQIPRDKLRHKDNASALAADPVQGGLWLGFFNGGIEYFRDGEVRASFGAADGLGEGRVSRFQLDPDGIVWAATEGGLSRLKDGRIATLTGKNGLPCDAVHWVIRDNDVSFWLYMPCGLVRISHSELDAWAAAADRDNETRRMVQATVFDSSDGVTSHAGISRFDFGHFRPGGYTPQVARSADGKLWFSPGDAVSVVDPHHLPFNNLPPPVHVEQIVADHRVYAVAAYASGTGNVRLLPRVRDLQIDYTALSLVAPEKVLFRYKLEGWDRDWQQAGTLRQAFYSNLPPRRYTFRVKACNNSGVWNEAGAALDFVIPPAYYQTTWFRLSCAAAFAGLLFAFHRLRLHQQARQFNVTLDARVSERTRIARELHDTMLQTFQAVMLKLYSVTYLLKDRPEARRTVENLIDQASQALSEGREAVQGMRSSTVVRNDLALALTKVGEQLASDQSRLTAVDFCVRVDGESHDLHPILRDEVYRIGGEAIRNAYLHSGAGRIEVEICYDARQLRMRVRDNGKGIDPKILEEGGRAGHYGLPGMHERARSARGKLTIWSELGSGTEVELTIPASLAYATSPAPRRSIFLSK